MEREYLGLGLKAAGGFLGVILLVALLLALAAGLSALMVYGVYASVSAFVEDRVVAGVLWGMVSSVLFFTNLGISRARDRR
jgi:FlaG/FlaF family flagellin (archaellin)